MADQTRDHEQKDHDEGESTKKVQLPPSRSIVTSATRLVPLGTLDLIEHEIIIRHGHILAAVGCEEDPSSGV
jgi:hypothetical protein